MLRRIPDIMEIKCKYITTGDLVSWNKYNLKNCQKGKYQAQIVDVWKERTGEAEMQANGQIAEYGKTVTPQK